MNFYIHIPFCRQKCPYCKFALTPIFDEAKKRRYLAHLKNEIREYFVSVIAKNEAIQISEEHENGLLRTSQGPKHAIDTIYFGGGTPSVLSLDEVASILECFDRVGNVNDPKIKHLKSQAFQHSNIPTLKHSNALTFQPSNPEITFECNPEDITSEYISGLLTFGINRISLGVQSLNDKTLKAIYRSDRESIFQALENIESVMGGMQGNGESEGATLSERRGELKSDERKQSESEFVDPSGAFGTFTPQGGTSQSGKVHSEINNSLGIDFILGLPHAKPGETLENIRELHARFPRITHTSVYMLEDGHYPREWSGSSITEGEMREEYATICDYFASLGWHHYEISNWARPGYESRHNQGYWTHTDSRGFGLSATSYIDGRRFENSASFSGYYRGQLASEETLTHEQIALEDIIHGIRTFSLDQTHFDPKVLTELEREGQIEKGGRKIRLTPAGIFQENTIITRLIDR